jgi:hypothetical protein
MFLGVGGTPARTCPLLVAQLRVAHPGIAFVLLPRPSASTPWVLDGSIAGLTPALELADTA